MKARRKRTRPESERKEETALGSSRSLGRNGHDASFDGFDEPNFFKEVKEELQARLDAAAKPATDAQLAQIWPPWNALPVAMQAEERRWILTGFGIEGSLERHRQLDHLRARFDYLPLDRNVFHHALDAAVSWTKLVAYYKSTVNNHADLVERQWAFREADAHSAWRIAIARAAKEIQLTNPGLLDRQSPTLDNINLLQSRYHAYTHAREQALVALAKLTYKIPGICTGRRLPLDQQALGLPYPPDDVPRHLYIARLDALGICSAERFADFMQQDFPLLTLDEQRQFHQISRKPQFGKEPYAAFLVWMHDNMPVFTRFHWLLKDIRDAAQAIGVNCPIETPGTDRLHRLKQWIHNNHLSGKLKRGSPGWNFGGIEQSRHLPSPAPVFGDILRRESSGASLSLPPLRASPH